jgi:hypothetical protein
MKKNTLTILFVVLLGCGDKVPRANEVIVPDRKKVSLFISPPDKDNFVITINDSLTFNRYKVDESEHGPQELITIVDKLDPKIKIQLRIRDRDTAFSQNIEDVDSLIFGLSRNNHFVIFNQSEYIWGYD